MDFHLHLAMRWDFIMSFLIKLMQIQKHLSKQSLPEDGLNTRNRAGNDSKQQAYTHTTVFNQITFIVFTTLTCSGHSNSKDKRNNKMDFYDLLGEKVIRKRKATTNNDRAPKRLCVEGPPVHKRSFLVQTTLEWKINGITVYSYSP